MKKILYIFFIFTLIFCANTLKTLADAAPIDAKTAASITGEKEKIPYKEGKKDNSLLYVSKTQDNKNTPLEIKLEDKKQKNIKVENLENVLSEATRKINAIYPDDIALATNTFPGYRGANQLVIYKKDYGKTTGTNEFGKEAVVVDDIVVKLTGANSNIPRNGYVISGHGSAKKMD